MELEQAVEEIARQHKVVLGKDDPILMLVTMQKMLLQESQNAQKQALDDFRFSLERTMKNWHSQSKSQAEKIINASIVAAKNAIAAGAAAGIGEGSQTLAQAVETVSKQLEKQTQKIISQNRIMMASAGFLILLALIISFVR